MEWWRLKADSSIESEPLEKDYAARDMVWGQGWQSRFGPVPSAKK